MIYKLLILMMIGHILGDFYFQTDKIASEKDKKFKGVMTHAVEYTLSVLVVILPIINLHIFMLALYMSLLHFVIDTIKYFLLKWKFIKKSGGLFVYDQIMHIISILVLAYVMVCNDIRFSQFPIVSNICEVFNINLLSVARWILAILLLHTPSNILIQNVLSGYRPKKENSGLIEIDNKAGRKIGTIERLIMIMFISMNQYAAMGLVLTAKSIARYDKITKDEKFAEYYLLGTLISTACVVACKMIVLR